MVAPTKSLDDALDEIAALAKIPEDSKSYFRGLVRNTIGTWDRPRVKKLKLFSDESIASQSKAVMSKAHGLLADLKTMEKGNRADNALGIAGLRFRAAAIDEKVTIKHFIDQLESLAKVAKAAASDIDARRSKGSAVGRPSGTSGNLGFDFFIRQLHNDARTAGGKLTIYKKRDGSGFSGSPVENDQIASRPPAGQFCPENGPGMAPRPYCPPASPTTTPKSSVAIANLRGYLPPS